jgi:hypothetical protein
MNKQNIIGKKTSENFSLELAVSCFDVPLPTGPTHKSKTIVLRKGLVFFLLVYRALRTRHIPERQMGIFIEHLYPKNSSGSQLFFSNIWRVSSLCCLKYGDADCDWSQLTNIRTGTTNGGRSITRGIYRILNVVKVCLAVIIDSPRGSKCCTCETERDE